MLGWANSRSTFPISTVKVLSLRIVGRVVQTVYIGFSVFVAVF